MFSGNVALDSMIIVNDELQRKFKEMVMRSEVLRSVKSSTVIF